MLTNRTDILILQTLSQVKDLVAIEKIPHSFKDDFDKYFFGKTLVKKEQSFFAYPHDIKQWVKHVFSSSNQ